MDEHPTIVKDVNNAVVAIGQAAFINLLPLFYYLYIMAKLSKRIYAYEFINNVKVGHPEQIFIYRVDCFSIFLN